MRHVEIIAEAGCNHNGRLGRAIEMVSAAAKARADIFKTQTSVPELEVSAVDPIQLDMVRRITLPFEATRKLARICEDFGIEFMSTPADPVSLKFLIEECGVRRLKFGSDNLTNPQMLMAAEKSGLPLILSTGMATMTEIAAALAMVPSLSVTLMQCTSCYPAEERDANLAAMQTLRAAFNRPVGFSDHTRWMNAAMVAVGAGAVMIEKHFTLNKSMRGPDHAMSMEPPEFLGFVNCIRDAEIIMGHGEKVPTLEEKENASKVRKSLVAARDIRSGEEFNSENIAVKRPGTGRSPWDYFDLIGKPARRNYAADEMID